MKAATVAGATAARPFLGGRPVRAAEVGESQVVMGYGVSLVQLDPHKNENMVHESVLRNMYECLVTFSQDLKSSEPQLATEWKRLNDLTVQFKLRQNVKFHNGEDFDADAVKFSLNRMLDPKTQAPLLSMYNTIDRVDVLDKYTVNITTKKADPVLLRRLSGICTIIVPPKYFSTAKPEELATRPIGTGPYKFVSWQKDADLVMEANPNYWGGAPSIKKVIVKGIPETGTRVAALLAGDVDIIPAVPPDDIDRINRSGKARIVTIPGNRVVFYFMDAGKKPTDNKLVRQAVNYGANIDAIIKTVLGGRGYRRATLINPWHVGYDPEIKPFPYDPEKAKALLREAGYPNGVEMNLHQVQGRVPKDKEVGEAIAGELGKVGIKVNLRLMDWGTSFTQASAGKLDGLKFGSWGNIMQDADLSFYGQYHSSTIYSKFFRSYQNPKLDSLMEEARSVLDVGKRTSLYSQVQKILMDDCPDLYCYAIEDVYGINNRIEWQPRTDEYVFYKTMSLAKR
jgi:peptide/nickel transport system substrate-binding protein